MQSAGAQQLNGEEEGLLELVVDLARLHRRVECRSVWCVLVGRSEEAAKKGNPKGQPKYGAEELAISHSHAKLEEPP